MRIGMDTQSMVGRKTGIGYYAQNLLNCFQRMDDVDLLCYSNPDKLDFNTLERIYWDNIGLISSMKNDVPELLHIPGFAGPLRNPGCKKLTTVCDLIGMIYPENLNTVSRFYWQRWLPACVKRSDMIIAISEHTKRDIIRLLGVPEEKIHVTLLAADDAFRLIEDEAQLQRITDKYDLPEEFMLNIGTVEPRKNIPILIEAYAAYLEQNRESNLKFVISGKKDWGFDEVKRVIDKNGISENIIFTDYIDDDEMPAMYSKAKIFAYPSYYEGFGLPILEALSCGTPVICSNVSSIPEVVGDAAIMVDPDDVKGFADAIRLLDTDEVMHKTFSEKALKQADKFAWQKTADETLKVYEKVLS